ncbi:MAG: hypothetical protein V1689_09035 [Pseudomonadota bacterium]
MYITRRDLERALTHFAPLTICQPWFMERPMPGVETPEASLVRVERPSEDMRPYGDFLRLLSEYQLWMSQNLDKGYTTFLGLTSKKAFSEDTPWEIRGILRQMGQDPRDISRENSLKWHLTLHLARQWEENQSGVEDMLKRLKQQGSPLAGAIEEGGSYRSMFKDLPSEGTYLFAEEHHIRQVLEAWLGLFGWYLADHDETLLTLSRPVADYVTETFEEKMAMTPEATGELRAKESDCVGFRAVTWDLPTLWEPEKGPGDRLLFHLAKKTLTLMEGEEIG